MIFKRGINGEKSKVAILAIVVYLVMFVIKYMSAELLNKHSIDVLITKEGFEGKGLFYVFSNTAAESRVAGKTR